MGYVLLWVEGMAVALLCLALAAAWTAVKGSFLRVAGTAVVFLVFFGMAAFATHATGEWQSHWPFQAALFVSSLSWLLVYLVSSVILLRRAFHRPAPGLARTGAGWPRKNLWLSLGGAVLAFGLTFWNLDLAARADLAVARQEAGDLLLTMTPPPVADSENAARFYIEAGKDLIAPIRNPWHDAALRGVSADPRGEVNWKDPYIVELVAKQEKVLTLLRKAAAMPPCNLDGRRSLDDPDAWSNPGLHELRRNEEVLLAADARVKAAQGNRRRAFEDIAAILGSTRHAQFFLSAPALLGTQTRAWRTLEDVLRLAPDTKDPLPSVPFPETISPLRIVHQELAVFGMIWPAADSFLRNERVRASLGPWLKPPRVYLTETLVLPACRVFGAPAELRASHQRWEAYRRVLRSAPGGTPEDWAALRELVQSETGIWSALFTRPKEKVLFRDGGQVAALGPLARAGLAAARYRDKHGHYPERLEQLVPAFLPAMPVDPRDGQVLRWKHFPGVTVLYTLQDSPGLETERSWDPEKHRDEPIFRLYPRGSAK